MSVKAGELQDVQRDFARLQWPASALPDPSVLQNPRVREWLAIINSTANQLATGQVAVPTELGPGQQAFDPGHPTAPIASAARKLGPHAHASQTGQVGFCGVSLSSYISGGTTHATAGFSCPAAVYYEDNWTTWSDYTGHLISGPWYHWNFTDELPTPSQYDAYDTNAGTAGHRSVHWDVTLCAASCGGTILVVANT